MSNRPELRAAFNKTSDLFERLVNTGTIKNSGEMKQEAGRKFCLPQILIVRLDKD